MSASSVADEKYNRNAEMNNFSRVFSKRMGLSPSEYRRQKCKEEALAK